jgi:hypothetical protein
MNIRTFTAADIASFDSDVLMESLPVSIGGWSRRSMIVEAAIIFTRPFFAEVEELASDEDIIALADLIDELGKICFSRAATLNIDIQSLVYDYRTGVLDIDNFESQIESGVVCSEYLSSSKAAGGEMSVSQRPGYFSVDFNRTSIPRLFCAEVLHAFAARSAQDFAESALPQDRANLDRWLANQLRTEIAA